MDLLTIILCFFIFIAYISLFFNQTILLSLNAYISIVILGYCVIIYHIGRHHIPIDLIIVLILSVILIHLKHRHLFNNDISLRFMKRLYKRGVKLIVITLACAYISLMPIGINIIFLWLAAIAFSALFTFVCYATWSSAYATRSNNVHYDVILTLGAGIFTEEVTPMLAKRLDKALVLFNNNSDATMIVSGGQGPDEPIPESLAMKRYLIANGVPEQQIIMEYQSTNTFENIKNTKDLLATYIPRQAQVVCVTSQFHVLRALRFGQILNVRMTGLGSTTPYHFLEIALIRDFLGLMYQYRLLLTVYFAILFFICIISFWQIPSYL